MADGERICVSCRSAKQTAEVCGVCNAPLILGGHFEAVRETSDALDDKAFDAVDGRTGSHHVLAPLAIDPVSPALAAKLDKRLRSWRTADAESAISLVKLIRVGNGGESMKLLVVRERASGERLEAHRRLVNEEGFTMARTVLRAIASVQSGTPSFRHGAIIPSNIVVKGHRFVLGPPSFEARFLEESPDGARTDVEQLASLVREHVKDEQGEVAESWKRWLARASGRGESQYRNAKAALAGLDTVREKAASDPAWRGVDPRVAARSSKSAGGGAPASAPTPPATNTASPVAPGGTPNAKRKKKQERRALAAAAEASGHKPKKATSSVAAKSKEDLAKETGNRAFTAGVFLVLGVACLAVEMISMGN